MEKKDKKDKVNPKGFDPKKYVNLEPTDDASSKAPNSMFEEKNRTAVITFGRFSPPTIGHEKLVDKIKGEAAKRRADPIIYTSHTFDKKKNPLSYDEKINFLNTAFGKIVKKSAAKNIIDVAKELSGKYDNLVVVVGQDRVAEFDKLLNTYNGREYNFKTIEVISAGERDPDADDVSGMSASKLRSLAVAKNYDMFKRGLPKKLQPRAQEVYDTVLKGMGLMENEEILEENDLQEKIAGLSFSQRLKRSMVMRRYHAKIENARKRSQQRRASPEKLKDRAKRKALALLRARLSRAKAYSEMTPSEKIALDQRLSRIPQDVINRIANKQLPIVKKAEAERISAMHRPTNEELDLDGKFEVFLENFIHESSVNENYYAGLLKPAANTKRFHKLFKKEGTVNHDRRFKMYKAKKNIFESTETFFEELEDLIESVENFVEGQALDSARASIEREKAADAEKHKNMLDNARKIDARRKTLRNESLEIIKKIIEREKHHKKIANALKEFSKVAKHFDDDEKLDHAERIVKSHGVSIEPKDLIHLYNRIHNSKNFKKSYSAFDAWESVSYDEYKSKPSNREYGTDSLVKILKKDTPGESINEKLEKDKDDPCWKGYAQLGTKKKGKNIVPNCVPMEGAARGFEGEMVHVPNVPVRMIDRKIKSFPAGKSSSSKGGE